MQTIQHTIQAPVVLTGIGLHTGCQVNLTCLPADPDHGIQFQRIDLPNQPTLAAIADHVIDTRLSTTLGHENIRIATVEHILAAISGLEIDNILLQLDGPEVPILDGSALPFVQALQQSSLVEQGVPRRFLQVTEALVYPNETQDTAISVLPLDDYKLTVLIGYDHPLLQSQHASLQHIRDFTQEIAPCRTFAFLHDLASLHQQGLIQGGSLANALVFVKQAPSAQDLNQLTHLFGATPLQVTQAGILNDVALQYANEPARHKLLDLMGDLALVGRPIKGQVIAHKPGHAANVGLAKKLRKLMLEQENWAIPQYNPHSEPVFNTKQITNMLPHRYPFQLVDKIIQLNEHTVTGIKNVTINEPFFQGHFPNNPIMPGVLQIEALVQTGGVLVLSTVPDPSKYATYFLAIERCRFRKMVLPGDTLVMRCELLADVKRGIAKMKGTAFVGNALVCEAIMTAQIVKEQA